MLTDEFENWTTYKSFTQSPTWSAAFNWIAEMGYDPFFGARPIKRVIQKNVMNELSKALLSDRIDTSQNVILDVFDDQVVFRKPINEEEEVSISQ